jgi:uncharacterized protein (UPF0179 family)
MATCKDCIHYEVCKHLDGTIAYTVESVTGDVVKKIEVITCGKFVNREQVEKALKEQSNG